MNRLPTFLAAALSVCLPSYCLAQPAIPDWNASGQNGAVASGEREATAAGLEMLRGGGNAADAAAATLLVQAVTESGSYCFGGEVPIIVYDAQRNVVEVISGMGTAPKLATLAHFAERGIPNSGIETAAVPAAPGAILTLLDRYGTRSFEQAAQPMLRVLDRHGKEWHADLAVNIRRMIAAEKASPDRRRGLRLAADCFYRGSIARDIDAWSRANGGLIRYTDLATYSTLIEEPASVDYRGYTVCKCGPWTQGPFLLQSLRLLEGTDVKALGQDSPGYIHQVTEVMKLALADRDVYYADPLFAEVPLEQLLSKSYADLRRPLIDPQKASHLFRPGDPRSGKAELAAAEVPAGKRRAANDTTTCLTADRFGNVVAATPSGWGGVMAGKTGVQLGSRLISLNTKEGSPNCIEPGKRPRITLTPTLVLKDNKPCLAVSVAGGDLQDQVSLQVLLSSIDFGLPADKSVTAPRFSTAHHIGSFNQPPPSLGSLTINEDLGEKTAANLAARGHKVNAAKGAIGAPVVISIDAGTGQKHVAGDPKAGRRVGAY
ncbi:MAG: gamma-glutamyltransferase [Pirellulaceae bacterium]|nr:gamma-glutamyltransferase [Pirellulaceae bacterium]